MSESILGKLETINRPETYKQLRPLMTATAFSLCSMLVTLSLDNVTKASGATLFVAAGCILLLNIARLASKNRRKALVCLELLTGLIQVGLVAAFFKLSEDTEVSLQLMFTFSLMFVHDTRLSMQVLRVVLGVVCIAGQFRLGQTYGVILAGTFDSLLDTVILVVLLVRLSRGKSDPPRPAVDHLAMPTDRAIGQTIQASSDRPFGIDENMCTIRLPGYESNIELNRTRWKVQQ